MTANWHFNVDDKGEHDQAQDSQNYGLLRQPRRGWCPPPKTVPDGARRAELDEHRRDRCSSA
jgi:hypothetical protein